MQQVICLVGPTASGKTQLAIDWAQRYPVEIISVDSAMVYRDMDIGTAKPDAKTLAVAPHHLIDMCDPAEPYSAAQFVQDALRCIEQIHQCGKIPLLVGGTMMYFKALLEGLSDLPEADEGVRRELLAEAEKVGWPAMHAKLARIDPESFERLKPNDSQRIQRALEIYELTGEPISKLWRDQKPAVFPYRYQVLGIAPDDRTVLHARIALRFQHMLDQGFLAEVESLYQRNDLHTGLPSIRSVGYRQAWQVLAGELPMADLFEKGVIATRQLAKRQLTWLRHWGQVNWVVPGADPLTDILTS